MKWLNNIIGIFYLFIFLSCKKQNIQLTPLASLNITNTVVGGSTAKIRGKTSLISNDGFVQISLLTGENELYIYPSADSLKPYYDRSFSIDEADTYSLFLAGTPTQLDAILIKDVIPTITDSSFGVRFINLSPNSNGISINLSGNANGTEVGNLSYKQITGFKLYPGLSNASNYAFQIRDASTGNLLTTYSFLNPSNPIPRFGNVTLVIKGLVGSSPSIGVIKVNNDR